MKTKELLKVALRQNAIFIPSELIVNDERKLNATSSVLVANVAKLGFAFSEDLLIAINNVNPKYKLDILETLKEITGVDKNWTPLVKGWDVPTGESIKDHIITFFYNVLGVKNGTTLSCGHIIPNNTFPLERYNGCPFCGTPFEFGKIENYGQGSKLKVLELWNEEELNQFFADLLASKTALDATQVESVKTLLSNLPFPKEVTIGIKETLMLVVDTLVENERADEVQSLFKSPTDILRYLWYKHTGFLQIIAPKTIIGRTAKNSKHIFTPADTSGKAKLKSKADLKLKYNRKECKRVATWLNALELTAEQSCEIMHPKREMWVRFIRALRLAEYSKRKGFDKLAELLDVFYNQKYKVWQGSVNHFRLRNDAEKTFALLKQRPGLFARSLFSNMLWFGDDLTLKHFSEIIDQLPARLIFTLNMYAQIYFDKTAIRSVKPLGGTNKKIAANKLLALYEDEQLEAMQNKIEDLCLQVMKTRFAKIENSNQSIFIEKALYNIPVAIGDRSETIQDLPSALMGTRFPLEGDKVRLFMQWGNGLPAQRLDMDLSCSIAYANKVDRCSYSRLVTIGCKHSGDILEIPNKVGTAEYIEIDFRELAKHQAKYVSFTCNAYSNGSISPNLVVGWMDSKHEMKISKTTGVAYDPSCVQHQVRITQGLTKGLVFGVLDVAAKEIIWLEMSFAGQVVQGLDVKGVKALMNKLSAKLNVGNLLEIKAIAQSLEIVEEQSAADEVYDMQWARNTAAVTKLLVD